MPPVSLLPSYIFPPPPQSNQVIFTARKKKRAQNFPLPHWDLVDFSILGSLKLKVWNFTSADRMTETRLGYSSPVKHRTRTHRILSSITSTTERKSGGAYKMAQGTKVSAARTTSLSLIFRTHMVEVKNWFPQVVLQLPYVCPGITVLPVYTCMHK